MAKDDAVDSFRYAVSRIPWDWGAITERPQPKEREKSEWDIRREFATSGMEELEIETAADEIDAMNDLLEDDYGYDGFG